MLACLPPPPCGGGTRAVGQGRQLGKLLLGLSPESSLQVGIQCVFAKRAVLSCVNRGKGCVRVSLHGSWAWGPCWHQLTSSRQ